MEKSILLDKFKIFVDKTNLEIESPVDGTVKKINFSVNDNIQVGDTILIIK